MFGASSEEVSRDHFFEKKDGAKRALVTQQLTETISDDVENLIAAIRDQPMPFAEAKKERPHRLPHAGRRAPLRRDDAEATQEAQTMERDLGIRIEPYTSKAEREARIMSERLSLFQSLPSVIKGSTDVFPDGRFLIKAFEAADVATMIHEVTHGFKQMLYVAERHATGETKARLGADEGARRLGRCSERRADVAAEEKFATGMEQYLRSGQAPTPALKKLFAQFKEWLGRFYDDLTGRSSWRRSTRR